MEKIVTVDGKEVTVSIEVKRVDKYHHILILNDVEHPVRVAIRDNPGESGGELFSHFDYKGEKVVDKNGKVFNTDKGLVEYILNRK